MDYPNIKKSYYLCRINLVFKRYNKFRSHIDFAFHRDVASQTVNVVVHQIESYAFAVNMIVEFLVQPKNLVFNDFHIKSKSIIQKSQLADSIGLSGMNWNNWQTARLSIFNGICY